MHLLLAQRINSIIGSRLLTEDWFTLWIEFCRKERRKPSFMVWSSEANRVMIWLTLQ